MKRIVLVLACVLMVGVVNAQEKKFDLGAEIKMSTFNNYSAISLFQDETDSYSTWSPTIHFGVRKGKNMFGLQFQGLTFNTSKVALNEEATLLMPSIMMRHYENVGEHFEPFFGIKVGAAFMQNRFYYINDQGLIGETYNENRWGFISEFEVGINYKLNNDNYFGVSAGMYVSGSYCNYDYELPIGQVANKKYNLGGYNISFTYGFRF